MVLVALEDTETESRRHELYASETAQNNYQLVNEGAGRRAFLALLNRLATEGWRVVGGLEISVAWPLGDCLLARESRT